MEEEDFIEKGSSGKVDVALLVEENVSWFCSLRQDCDDQVTTPLDAVSLYLHAFMLELGFIGEEEGGRLPKGWKGPRGYVTRYSFGPVEGKTTSVILTITSLGPIIKVHGTHSDMKTSFSTSRVKPGDYIMSKGDGEGNKTQFESKNLNRLARLFKDEVGLCLLQSCRSKLGLQVSGLQGLPPELLLRILSLLNLPSLISLSKTSKQLLGASQTDTLWKNLYLNTFVHGSGLPAISSGPRPWFNAFKNAFVIRAKNKAFQESRPKPPLFPFPDHDPGNMFGPDPPPAFPGILGGDYDRLPGGGVLPGIPLFGGNSLNPSHFLPRPRFDPPGPGSGLFPPGRGSFGGGGFGGGGGFF